ncbi:hypothetical protein LSAT2_000706 [Lamellibrachia satsuma]|nr:hypothetical protein LSAT2_000706 [Lamellibrachia satsuma]
MNTRYWYCLKRTTPYWAFSIFTSRYNQVIMMKTIILVVAICLLLPDGINGLDGDMLQSCKASCGTDFRKCSISCLDMKTTPEEDNACQDSYLNPEDNTPCVRDECNEACSTKISRCVKACNEDSGIAYGNVCRTYNDGHFVGTLFEVWARACLFPRNTWTKTGNGRKYR